MRKLEWTADTNGFAFRVGGMPQPSGWAAASIATSDRRAAHVGPLLALLEDGVATEGGDSLTVPHAAIAELSVGAIRGLGLPDPIPFRLVIPNAKSAISDPSFRFSYRLLNNESRAQRISERRGALIEIGGRSYTLPSPLFQIVEEMDRFNAQPTPNLDDRMRVWGVLRSNIPDSAVEDAALRQIVICRPGAFTLRPKMGADGQLDFDPEPRVFEPRRSPDQDTVTRAGLPEAHQEEFARGFRKLSPGRPAYPAGKGVYVVLDPPIRRALEVAHRIQHDPDPRVRRSFVENPRVFLKESLGDELDEELLDSIFTEEGYGERVRAVGLWQPRVLPWKKLSAQEWLPPEEIGLRVGDELVHLKPTELRALRARIEDAQRGGLPSVRTDSGALVPASNEALAAIDRLLATAAVETGREGVAPTEQGKELDQRAGPTVLIIKDHLDEVDYKPAQRIRPGVPGTVPPALCTPFLPHQMPAVRWLQDHWCGGSPGALLADDMGLGKTFQTLAFLSWIRELMRADLVPNKPILIVAPTGLLRNWLDEHKQHLNPPGLGEIVHAFGQKLTALRTSRGHAELDAGLPTLDVQAFERADCTLTTFETLRNYQHSFGRVSWSVVVMDEAQKIKNPAAQVTDAAKAMKADFRIALTGTPVENRLTDLWCIVDTIQPGRLGALKQFSSEFEHDELEEATAAGESLQRIVLGDPPPPLMLRRLKEDHLDGLPQMERIELRTPMPPGQAEAYADVISRARGVRGSPEGMLKVLHQLRSISLHPDDLTQDDDGAFIKGSARLSSCIDTLDEVADRNEKALVFVEFLAMQASLTELIQRRYTLASPPMLINGEVSGDKRKERVDRFQQRAGFDVMILSPKAGGVGLTLTAANHVIHLSRWWNPAVEDQCSDRVYRIGQKRPVRVYLPMAVHPEIGDHSFDLQLHNLLTKKRQLSRSVLAPVHFSQQDAQGLFDRAVSAQGENL